MLVTYVTKIAPIPSLIQLGNGANIKIPKQEISCTVHDRVVVLIMHSFLELTRRVSFLTDKVRESFGVRLHVVAHKYKNNCCFPRYTIFSLVN